MQKLKGLIDNVNTFIVEIAYCNDIKVYIEPIRLMYCKDLMRNLMKDDITRVLVILNVKEIVERSTADREKRKKSKLKINYN